MNNQDQPKSTNEQRWIASQIAKGNHGYQSNGAGACRKCGLPYSSPNHSAPKAN